MLLPLLFGIAWNVVLTVVFIVQPAPGLDKHRCYVDQPTFTKVCWPTDRCFRDTPESVLCWRVVKVQAARD